MRVAAVSSAPPVHDAMTSCREGITYASIIDLRHARTANASILDIRKANTTRVETRSHMKFWKNRPRQALVAVPVLDGRRPPQVPQRTLCGVNSRAVVLELPCRRRSEGVVNPAIEERGVHHLVTGTNSIMIVRQTDETLGSLMVRRPRQSLQFAWRPAFTRAPKSIGAQLPAIRPMVVARCTPLEQPMTATPLS